MAIGEGKRKGQLGGTWRRRGEERKVEEVVRTVVEILLVGKYQEQTILHLAVVDDAVQLLFCLVHARGVRRIDDENKTLSTCDFRVCLV